MKRTIGACAAALALTAWPDSAPAATFEVTKTDDTVDGACDADCSLREAVIASNADADADVIVLPAGEYALTISVAEEDAAQLGDLDILGPVTIRGEGPMATTVDGGGGDRVFHVMSDGAPVRLEGLRIRNGAAAGAGANGRGGGVYAVESRLTIEDCAIIGNTAASGGGLRIEDSSTDRMGTTLDLLGVTVAGNTTTGPGGGLVIGNYVERASIVRAGFLGNTAGGDGGAAWLGRSGPVEIEASTMSGNRGRDGGALYGTLTDPVTMRDVEITGNTAIRDGAGIATDRFTLTLVASELRGNVLDDTEGLSHKGGAIYLGGGALTIVDGTLVGNSARQGGAIENFGGNITIRGSSLVGNTAELFGGAIRFVNGVHVIENTTITGNTVTSDTGSNGELGGGGISSTSNGPVDVTLVNVTVADNAAPIGGQQLFCASCDNDDAFFRLRNTIIAGSGGVPACDVRFNTGPFESGGGNLSTDSSCDLTDPSDQTDVADVMLGFSADNGGVTRTRALLPGSPAIGAAVQANCPANDQRGFGRDGDCDSGAFEAGASMAGVGCPDDEAGVRAHLGYAVEEILNVEVGHLVLCLNGLTEA